jgi:hypothetical protein
MILDVNKIQEGECLAWVLSPVRTLAVWTSFNKAVKTKVAVEISVSKKIKWFGRHLNYNFLFGGKRFWQWKGSEI